MMIPCRDHPFLPLILTLLHVSLLHFGLIFAATSTGTPAYIPADKIFLNCGAKGHSQIDVHNWIGDEDEGSKFASSFQNSTAHEAANQDPSLPNQIPYLTSRIFTAPFTYSFPVTPGRKFVRLYFYPSTYDTYDAASARFSVRSGQFTLLKNFSSSQTAQALKVAYFIREFSINISSSQFLNLTFAPSSDLQNSYAFVNGIEIVSIPDIFSNGSESPTTVGSSSPYPIDQTGALQTMYRLNVGGNVISPGDDSGLFREWSDDTKYLFSAAIGVPVPKDPNVSIKYPATIPEYIAPTNVYATARSMGSDANINLRYSLSWIFPVDSGFSYLVRLHFCELKYPITKPNMRVFDIFISNQTAYPKADVIAWGGAIGVPVYKDYVTTVPEGSTQQNLWVALHPVQDYMPQFYDGILNGLEIFKLNTSDNLAGLNPIPPEQNASSPSSEEKGKKKKNSSKIAAVVGGGGAFVLVCMFLFAICRRSRGGKDSGSTDSPMLPLSLHAKSVSGISGRTNTSGSNPSSLPSKLCRLFSFAEIEAATNDFDQTLLLGVGGFGKVYLGSIDGGSKNVAIKRGNPMSDQGVHEFRTEIEMLSKLRHRHLVSLIGYCEENCEMILVYDYMAHGTLREHLYKTKKPPLPWKQRLEICIGAARGIHYLHTGAKHTIIHRDVKTTNILLDENWVAKVSDFGLSKTGPMLDNSHVSTVVKGSFGYLDPEYFRRHQLTEKSDVYSFGVVLFEVLCARPPLNQQLPKEQVSLAEWALHCQKKGVLDQLIDPYLKGKIAPQCLKKISETAEKCLSDQGIHRPAMGDVLWSLEFALQLQESAEETGPIVIGGKDDSECAPLMLGKNDHDDGPSSDSRSTGTTTTSVTSMSIGGRSMTSEESDGMSSRAVFSQIMNPSGR